MCNAGLLLSIIIKKRTTRQPAVFPEITEKKQTKKLVYHVKVIHCKCQNYEMPNFVRNVSLRCIFLLVRNAFVCM